MRWLDQLRMRIELLFRRNRAAGHALLLSTPPVCDPGELVRLTIDLSAVEKNGHDVPLNLPIIEAIHKASRTLHDVFAWCVYDFPFRDGNVNGGIHGVILCGNASSPEIPPVVFSESLRDSVARERLLSVLSGFFALLELLLSGIGIYGLVTWNVTRRTTEIVVRMALGATRPKVFLLVIRQIAGLLAIGVLCSGLSAIFAARSIRLFAVQPSNPWVFVLSALALVAMGLLAATLPARRAVSIDPLQALRTE